MVLDLNLPLGGSTNGGTQNGWFRVKNPIDIRMIWECPHFLQSWSRSRSIFDSPRSPRGPRHWPGTIEIARRARRQRPGLPGKSMGKPKAENRKGSHAGPSKIGEVPNVFLSNSKILQHFWADTTFQSRKKGQETLGQPSGRRTNSLK